MARLNQVAEWDIPTPDEQFFRIVGTTAGGAIFGGAVASTAGLMVIVGTSVGGLLGLAVSGLAAFRAIKCEVEDMTKVPDATSPDP